MSRMLFDIYIFLVCVFFVSLADDKGVARQGVKRGVAREVMYLYIYVNTARYIYEHNGKADL